MTPTFLSTILRDFLASAASITAGVPDITMQSMDATQLAAPPRLLVRAESDDEVKLSGTLVIVVTLELAIADGTANQRSILQGWMRTIRTRLLDGETFQGEELAAWIDANVSEEDRAGWRIVKMRLYPGQEAVAGDPDSMRQALLLQELRFTIHLS